MRNAAERPLTDGERSCLSPGLVAALDAAAIGPVLVARPHPFARVATLWQGGLPILARPERVFWPGVPHDLSDAGDAALATLQHELQHLLDYATGALTALGYLTAPRNWDYSYRLGAQSRWSDFAAEQRARIAEHFWLLEHGRHDLVELALGQPPAAITEYRRVLPWA